MDILDLDHFKNNKSMKENDDFDAYGITVVNSLRSLPRKLYLKAKRKINDIIADCEETALELGV